jgi:hypothetical protein
VSPIRTVGKKIVPRVPTVPPVPVSRSGGAQTGDGGGTISAEGGRSLRRDRPPFLGTGGRGGRWGRSFSRPFQTAPRPRARRPHRRPRDGSVGGGSPARTAAARAGPPSAPQGPNWARRPGAPSRRPRRGRVFENGGAPSRPSRPGRPALLVGVGRLGGPVGRLSSRSRPARRRRHPWRVRGWDGWDGWDALFPVRSKRPRRQRPRGVSARLGLGPRAPSGVLVREAPRPPPWQRRPYVTV